MCSFVFCFVLFSGGGGVEANGRRQKKENAVLI